MPRELASRLMRRAVLAGEDGAVATAPYRPGALPCAVTATTDAPDTMPAVGGGGVACCAAW